MIKLNNTQLINASHYLNELDYVKCDLCNIWDRFAYKDTELPSHAEDGLPRLRAYMNTDKNGTNIIICFDNEWKYHNRASIEATISWLKENVLFYYQNVNVVPFIFLDDVNDIGCAEISNAVTFLNGKILKSTLKFSKSSVKILKDIQFFIKLAKMERREKIADEINSYFEYGGYNVLMTYIFIVINIFVYFRTDNLIGVGVNEVFYQKNVLTLLYAMFFHANLRHLLGNMVMLFILGKNLESNIGSLRFSFVYLVGGMIGNLLSTSYKFDTKVSITTVGASGGIFALLGAIVLYQSYDFVAKKLYVKKFIGALILSIAYIYMCSTDGQVDNMAHIGGFIGGFAFTFIYECLSRIWIQEVCENGIFGIEMYRRRFAYNHFSKERLAHVLEEERIIDNDKYRHSRNEEKFF